jgi:hypothetical protein
MELVMLAQRSAGGRAAFVYSDAAVAARIGPH